MNCMNFHELPYYITSSMTFTLISHTSYLPMCGSFGKARDCVSEVRRKPRQITCKKSKWVTQCLQVLDHNDASNSSTHMGSNPTLTQVWMKQRLHAYQGRHVFLLSLFNTFVDHSHLIFGLFEVSILWLVVVTPLGLLLFCDLPTRVPGRLKVSI